MARKRSVSHPKPPKPKTPRPRPPRPPDVSPTHRVTVAAAAGRGPAFPAAGPRGVAGAASALELAAPSSAGLADAILDIVGADHATLRATLTAWQREQDRVVNRSWRRPGGLVRPAGL